MRHLLVKKVSSNSWLYNVTSRDLVSRSYVIRLGTVTPWLYIYLHYNNSQRITIQTTLTLMDLEELKQLNKTHQPRQRTTGSDLYYGYKERSISFRK